jgi:hypothetical protein
VPPAQPEYFDFYGISHIYWPFEGSWNDSHWRNGNYFWYGGSHYGQDKHQCNDYYSMDYAEIGETFYDRSLTCQSPFYSPINGVILHITDGFNSICDDSPYESYGNQIVIQSNSNYDFAFRVAHLYQIQPTMYEGRTVAIGELLGWVGSTGAEDPHAHVSLYKNIHVSIPELNGYTLFNYLQNGQSTVVSDYNTCQALKFYSAEFEFDASDNSGGGGGIGLNEIENSDVNFTVHPNPNYGEFYIDNPQNLRMRDLVITDELGRQLSFMYSNGKIILDNISPGIYQITFYTTYDTVVRRRLVVV